MALKIADNADLMKKLKCGACKQCLSVPPIRVSSEIGNICGRCNVPSKKKYERDTAYEILAKYCKFPCKNFPLFCNKRELQWIQVTEHENKCTQKFANVPCPFVIFQGSYFFECSWKGKLEDFLQHSKTFHQDLFLKENEIIIDLTETNINSHFFDIHDKTFIIVIRYNADSKMLTVAVMTALKSPEISLLQYQVELTGADIGSHTRAFKKKAVEGLEKTNEILENTAKTTTFVLSTDPIFGKLTTIMCKINIIAKVQAQNPQPSRRAKNKAPQNIPNKKNNESISAGPSQVTKVKEKKEDKSSALSNSLSNLHIKENKNPIKNLSEKDKEILDELECPICNNYMRPPIFICGSGHSFCKTCKDKISICPYCKELILAARNFALEKLTSKVPFPCKYKDHGCNEIALTEAIEKHEETCYYGMLSCPVVLKCSFKGSLSDLKAHILMEHKESVICLNTPLTTDIKAPVKTNGNAIFFFDEEIFVICVKHSNTNLRVNMENFGVSAHVYLFEIRFIDQTNSDLKFEINRQVQTISTIDAISKNGLVINLELLEPFMKDKILNYKILLSKKLKN